MIAALIVTTLGLILSRHANFAYMLIWAVYPVSTLKTQLRKPSPQQAGMDWIHFAPVHSDHWGKPPVS